MIVRKTEIIQILPADPQIIYVPQYQPQVVYVQQPPNIVAPLITFGAGLALGVWIHNELDWHHHGVFYHNSGWHGGGYGGNNNININNNNNINIGNGNNQGNGNRPGGGSPWKPKPKPTPPSFGPGNKSGGGGGLQKPQKPIGGNRPTKRHYPVLANLETGVDCKPGFGNSSVKPTRPQFGSSRPGGSSGSGFSREGTKPRPAFTANRPATAAKGGGGAGRTNRIKR